MERVPEVKLFKPLTKKNGKTYPSRTWWIRYWQNGRHVRESTGTANERVAKKIAAEKQAELEAGGKAIIDVGWDQAVKEFLDYKTAVCREATAPAYQWSLDAFAKIVKSKSLKQIDVAVLRDFAAARRKTCRIPTVNKDLRALRSLMYFAVSKHFIREVPKFREAWIREDELKPVNVPMSEYKSWIAKLASGNLQLKHHSCEFYLCFIKLIFHLGLRRSEALLAEWESVDLDAGTLTVVAENSKGRRTRTLPLIPELVADLRAWRAANPDETRVFPFEGDIRKLYQDWHLITDRRPKDCRSSCGTQLIEAGIPTAVVKDFLGHSNIAVTERHYVNATNSLRAAAGVRFLAK